MARPPSGEEHEADERKRLANEIRAEVVKGHALDGLAFEVVGRSTERDDVLVHTADGQWAIVHLSYQAPDNPPWPMTSFYDSARAVEQALAERD